MLGAATLAVGYDRRSSSPATGLEARVFTSSDWTGTVAATVRDSRVDPARVARQAGLDERAPFSIEWTGWLAVEEAGVHWFKLGADDGAAMWIDRAFIVDNLGVPTKDRIRGGSVFLSRGVHAIRLRYVQYGGDAFLRLTWATPSFREDWRPVPLFKPTPPPPSIQRIAWRHDGPLVVCALWSAWIALAAMAGGSLAAQRVWGLLRPLKEAPAALWAVIAGALILFVWSSGWGLAPWRLWALDEVMPADVLGAVGQRFSNGWHDIYPPLHYALLALLYTPAIVAERAGWLAFDDAAVTRWLHLIGRGFTVLLALATLVVVYLCGVEVGERRRAVWAVLVTALTLPFVYYAKTTNVDVPYVFWLTLSYLFFIRAYTGGTLADHCGLAIAAACAICTKDQAYGFYPGMAVALVVAAWRAPWSANGHRTWRDGRLVGLAAGAVIFAALFALFQNLAFNVEGFRAHLGRITASAGPDTYRIFPATPSGYLALTVAVARLVPWSLGWPMCLAVLCGLALAIAMARRSLVLGVPVASYALTFLAVVGYVYDRFLLGVFVVFALWAGVALDRLARWRLSGRSVGALAAALLVTATGLYSASVNVAMARDSRSSAEAWLAAHATDDPLVVAIGGQEYLPNLHPWRFRLTSADAADVLAWKAEWIVVNEALARRLASGSKATSALDRLERGDAGYERAFRERTVLPSYALLRFTAWWRSAEDESFTNLDKIGPTISIWRRISTDGAENAQSADIRR